MLLVVSNGDYTVTVYSNCVVTVQYGGDRWNRSFVVFAAAASACTIFVTVAAAYPLSTLKGTPSAVASAALRHMKPT